MKLLLTNDDGIYAPGLAALYGALSSLATCIVVAPEVEQSAVGHAITLFRPLTVRKARRNGRFLGHAVSGTPADCVKLGIRELCDGPPDLVVSGINLGANVGTNVIYSGTVSAATEAAILGVPALAFSLDARREADFTAAAQVARQVVQWMANVKPEGVLALNVNVPNLTLAAIKGIVMTRQGKTRLIENFDKRTDPRDNTYYWLAGETICPEGEAIDTDAAAVKNGWVSVTPIHYDLTAHHLFDRLPGITKLSLSSDRD